MNFPFGAFREVVKVGRDEKTPNHLNRLRENPYQQKGQELVLKQGW